MKYITFSLILASLIFTSCQNEDFTNFEEIEPESIEISGVEISGVVVEANSPYHFRIGTQRLHDVSIQLIHNGVVLEATNTDQEGNFVLASQNAPSGSFLLFEAPNFYPNVLKINEETGSFVRLPLMRKSLSFYGVFEEKISGGGPYINLSGVLQEGLPTDSPFYWISDSDNKLVGAALGQGDFSNFTITTLADESLFLHCRVGCFEEVFEIGPFSEDTDLGALVDQSYNFDQDWSYVRMDAFDCDGVALDGYGTYAKVNGFTRYSYANSGSVGFGDYECQLNMNPNIVISVASQNPRKYSQVDYSFTGGPLSTTELTLCEDDDTFIKYSIDGGDMIEANIFTYANLFPNGVMVLKQVDPVYAGGTDISFDITGYSVGGNSYGYVYFISYLSNAANNLSSSENLDVTITFRDDKFIEGTFGGSLSDVFENPLGILEGSFRARIQ